METNHVVFEELSRWTEGRRVGGSMENWQESVKVISALDIVLSISRD